MSAAHSTPEKSEIKEQSTEIEIEAILEPGLAGIGGLAGTGGDEPPHKPSSMQVQNFNQLPSANARQKIMRTIQQQQGNRAATQFAKQAQIQRDNWTKTKLDSNKATTKGDSSKAQSTKPKEASKLAGVAQAAHQSSHNEMVDNALKDGVVKGSFDAPLSGRGGLEEFLGKLVPLEGDKIEAELEIKIPTNVPNVKVTITIKGELCRESDDRLELTVGAAGGVEFSISGIGSISVSVGGSINLIFGVNSGPGIFELLSYYIFQKACVENMWCPAWLGGGIWGTEWSQAGYNKALEWADRVGNNIVEKDLRVAAALTLTFKINGEIATQEAEAKFGVAVGSEFNKESLKKYRRKDWTVGDNNEPLWRGERVGGIAGQTAYSLAENYVEASGEISYGSWAIKAKHKEGGVTSKSTFAFVVPASAIADAGSMLMNGAELAISTVAGQDKVNISSKTGRLTNGLRKVLTSDFTGKIQSKTATNVLPAFLKEAKFGLKRKIEITIEVDWQKEEITISGHYLTEFSANFEVASGKLSRGFRFMKIELKFDGSIKQEED